mgnify:CR=1 FL=1
MCGAGVCGGRGAGRGAGREAPEQALSGMGAFSTGPWESPPDREGGSGGATWYGSAAGASPDARVRVKGHQEPPRARVTWGRVWTANKQAPHLALQVDGDVVKQLELDFAGVIWKTWPPLEGELAEILYGRDLLREPDDRTGSGVWVWDGTGELGRQYGSKAQRPQGNWCAYAD